MLVSSHFSTHTVCLSYCGANFFIMILFLKRTSIASVDSRIVQRLLFFLVFVEVLSHRKCACLSFWCCRCFINLILPSTGFGFDRSQIGHCEVGLGVRRGLHRRYRVMDEAGRGLLALGDNFLIICSVVRLLQRGLLALARDATC